MSERIVVSCIRTETRDFFTGKNHAECLAKIQKAGLSHFNRLDGFMTNLSRFVDRKVGLKIAEEAKQIIKKHAPYDQLMSEDLNV